MLLSLMIYTAYIYIKDPEKGKLMFKELLNRILSKLGKRNY